PVAHREAGRGLIAVSDERKAGHARKREMSLGPATRAGHCSVAAAVQETANPTQTQPHRHRRGKEVDESPARQALFTEYQEIGQEIADQTTDDRAVQDQAAVPNLEKLEQRELETGQPGLCRIAFDEEEG